MNITQGDSSFMAGVVDLMERLASGEAASPADCAAAGDIAGADVVGCCALTGYIGEEIASIIATSPAANDAIPKDVVFIRRPSSE
jgi:hypothetical protein